MALAITLEYTAECANFYHNPNLTNRKRKKGEGREKKRGKYYGARYCTFFLLRTSHNANDSVQGIFNLGRYFNTYIKALLACDRFKGSNTDLQV